MTHKRFKIAILINYAAHSGRAKKNWQNIEGEILRLLPEKPEIISFQPPFEIQKSLKNLIENQSVNCIISAGGDGTVNHILNALMNLENVDLPNIYLGGIGLGSSNDFVKPVNGLVRGLPLRLDFEKAILSDLGKVSFISEDGLEKSRYFIANASLGVTAEANLLFNKAGGIIHLLKDRFTNLAIILAALQTIFTFKNYKVKLNYDAVEKQARLSNLAILKNPHVSGDFKYDQPILANDGNLGFNLCENMSRLELIKTLWDLSKGRFSGKPKRHSLFIQTAKVKTEHIVALETDGEVFLAKDPGFSILPKAIGLLGNGSGNSLLPVLT